VRQPAGNMDKKRHVFQLRDSREAVALARWLYPFAAEELLGHLGLNSPWWWCGLRVPRRPLFGGQFDGDVDILAGPLELEPASDVARAVQGGTSHGIRGRTAYERVLDAVRSAKVSVRWPPRVTSVVACEVKVSWFDTELCKMKRTHEGEGEEVKGGLRSLLSEGIGSVSFLHLVVTKPTRSGFLHPWLQALFDGDEAAKSLQRAGPIYDPRELPTCGYLTCVVGAVAHKTEDEAGAGGTLRVVQACSPNCTNSPPRRVWQARLSAHLRRCDPPTTPCTYVLACAACGRWKATINPVSVACDCGADLQPAI
jgi:hypothetical protein